MSDYVALIDGHFGAFGVVVPDLPGCSSGAATADEALIRAKEAVSLWAAEMLTQGGEIPAPRTVEAVLEDPDIAAAVEEGAAVALVPLLLIEPGS
jgi:predicted RNase H-like HicB family nuclease